MKHLLEGKEKKGVAARSGTLRSRRADRPSKEAEDDLEKDVTQPMKNEKTVSRFRRPT